MKKRCKVCGALNFDRDVCSNCKADLSDAQIDYSDENVDELPGWANDSKSTKEEVKVAGNPENLFEKLPKRKFETKAFEIGKSGAPQYITIPVNQSTEEMQVKEIPFMGHNGSPALSVNNLTGVFFQQNQFDLRFQQRNDISIEIDNDIQQSDKMFSMLTIKTPNINVMPDAARELFLIPAKSMKPSPENPKYVQFRSKGEDAYIDFGNLIIASTGLNIENQENKNVLSIKSTVPIKEYLEGKANFNSAKVEVDLDVIKDKITEDPLIKHELFVKDENFRWEYPISIKAEVENPLMSFLKTLSVFEKENPETFEKYKMEDAIEGTKIKEMLNAKFVGGKSADFVGFYPSILTNTALATFKIHLTNSTVQQIFKSGLKNVEVKIKFPEKYSELYLPSNLRVIGPAKLESFFDNESDTLVWQENPLIAPGETVVYEFQCLWSVIQKIDKIKIEIRGEYANVPLVLDSFVYTTPAGFPVMGEGKDAVWNPGGIDTLNGIFLPGATKDGEYSEQSALANMVRKLNSVPSFLETVELNMDKIKANYEEILAQIENNKEISKKIKEAKAQ